MPMAIMHHIINNISWLFNMGKEGPFTEVCNAAGNTIELMSQLKFPPRVITGG